MDSNECPSLPLEYVRKYFVEFQLNLLCDSTCKRWLALFNDKRFVNKHLALVEEHVIRINSDRKVTIISPLTRACSSFSLPYEFQVTPDIYTMIHCDGLVLCDGSLEPMFESSSMDQGIKPESSYSINCFYGGIGYDGLSQDGGYKILRFGDRDIFRNQYTNTVVVDIYELKSNYWKKYKVSLDWHVVKTCRGVSLMGNMYWIAKWNQAGFFIQIFNFSTETFEPLASLPFDYGAYDVHNLSAFRGNNLSEKMEVWVTNMGKKEGEIEKQEVELHKRGFSWPFVSGYAYLPSLVPV
ncbi:LOW QUALITY PROTEIN: hypothetical protein HID58_011611 [Brassica napus]|uniref:F-box associated beta-propeller type 1 domain-containing protein n=1 Tax=Brassica napus TaxID=3708 RepID=A0ABQ8DYU3_BRANA|nr:LOW QUALITY PROTEIN: hypothetical protein HID58_011611 [Brassica napus]